MSEAEDDRAAAVERALSMPNWYHSIDLGGGAVTPGRWGEDQSHVIEALDAIDFDGARVLDVGCLDGRWSFEAERRGAREVWSIDVVSQFGPDREQYFEVARDILGSRARYDPNCSVYDVAALGIEDFDVVLFLGVYYHLKDPLLALARLRQVMGDGSTILIEGQVIHDDVAYARFFYRQVFSEDRTNWWVPTTACLREWIECSFLRVDWEFMRTPVTWDGLDATSRGIVLATAVRRQDRLLAVPDDELAAFDDNAYG
jgi:tRNA (mo5U34)-methyltransferase